MKRLSLLLVLFICSALVAQDATPVRQVLRPDTPLVLKDGEYVRHLTGGELWQDLGQYEAETKITNGAYEVESRGEKNFIVPMSPEVREKLRLQEEHFSRTAITAEPMAPGRGKEATLEIGYNQEWGQKDTFAAYVDALAKIYGSQESRAIHAHLNAGGYVFNYQVKALEFGADMNNTGSSATANIYLRIFGQTKYSSTTPLLYKKIFYSNEIGKTVRFFIGPVPVSVTGAIGGSAGFEAKLGVVGNGVQGTVTPGITSYGKADAGVDLWFVKAGVEGSIDLLIDYLPVSLTTQLITEGGLALDLNLHVENQLKALAGKIIIFAKVYALWEGWKTYPTTLFEWAGISKNWVLYDKSYKIPLN